MAPMENISCDWSLLPVDTINKIAESLPIPSRNTFRMVCKSWCSAVPPIQALDAWLLLPGEGPEFGEYTTYFSFDSIFTNTSFKCLSPLTSGMHGDVSDGWHCVGSQDSWLVLCDLYFNICFVNPVTGVRFDLPSFSSNPGFEFKYTTADDGSSVLSGFRDFRLGYKEGGVLRSFDRKDCYIRKIVFCSEPGLDNFIAVALFGFGDIAYYNEAIGSTWYGILKKPGEKKIEDIIYREETFWSIAENARITAYDFFSLESGFRRWYIELPQDPMFNMYKFIAFDNNDKLYMIIRNGDYKTHSDGKRKFHTRSLTVMKNSMDLHEDMRNGSWDHVEDLDGFSLFIGNNYGIFVSPEEYSHSNLRSNCVYITGIRDKDEIFDMGVYDMEKKSFELIYPHNIESNWAQPPPIWFEPFNGIDEPR